MGDINYIPTREGWLYLAVFNHLYSRAVVGWTMDSRMPTSLVNDALTMAIWIRRPNAGLLIHSDCGSQYASDTFQQLSTQHGYRCIMSRKGNCCDNAPSESCSGQLIPDRTLRFSSAVTVGVALQPGCLNR